ncbi:hypothetical protein Hanom_Chr05g00390731 [Helianthus anomalus]
MKRQILRNIFSRNSLIRVAYKDIRRNLATHNRNIGRKVHSQHAQHASITSIQQTLTLIQQPTNITNTDSTNSTCQSAITCL